MAFGSPVPTQNAYTIGRWRPPSCNVELRGSTFAIISAKTKQGRRGTALLLTRGNWSRCLDSEPTLSPHQCLIVCLELGSDHHLARLTLHRNHEGTGLSALRPDISRSSLHLPPHMNILRTHRSKQSAPACSLFRRPHVIAQLRDLLTVFGQLISTRNGYALLLQGPFGFLLLRVYSRFSRQGGNDRRHCSPHALTMKLSPRPGTSSYARRGLSGPLEDLVAAILTTCPWRRAPVNSLSLTGHWIIGVTDDCTATGTSRMLLAGP